MAAEIVPAGTAELTQLAEEIRWHEQQAEAAEREAVQHRLAIGEQLLRAKKALDHGAFVAWATGKDEGTLGFGWSHEWVRLHMQFAQSAARNPTRVGLLSGSGGLRGWLCDLRSGTGGAAAPAPTEPAAHPFDLPRNDYRLVLADPPWQYESWSGKSKDTRRRRVAEDEYPTMPLEAIKALPVAGVCAPDALLLCWVTMPLLREGLEVMAAWGFEYRTAFLVWGKLSDDRRPAVGFGRYTRSNGELCLLGRRGAGVKPVEGVAIANLVLSRRGRHSEKPLAQYDIIDRLFGRGTPKVELFARRRMPGWDVWGLEAPAHVGVLDLVARA